jgi:flagellar assembly factor FliW
MKSAAERRIQSTLPWLGSKDSIIHFAEGLIGFSECKNFVLLENEELAPFRLLQSTDKAEIGFLVLDPTAVVQDYYRAIPTREWETAGMTNESDQLAFVICIIGPSPAESTGNFQAPLIVNYQNMTGRQIILTDSEFSVRFPLL